MTTREDILSLTKKYFSENVPKVPVPGIDLIPASGKLLDEADLVNLVDSSLDMWLTTGTYAKRFEKEFATFMEQKFALLVNSGSSANLLAFAALTSPLLKERALRSGDEVITVATGFPTTVNPIIQYGCVPVFVDVDAETFNINISEMKKALGPKTKAVMIAHALGNPFDAKAVKDFCQENRLWLIEDCCDAVGARFQGKMVGTFGDLATVSFYPAHHMTMGEGGAVLTQDPQLKKIVESFRDWGRDCWCPTGVDNSCGKRFDWELGDLPPGYDHKYIYTHIGYNFKVTDMQAAIGLSQLQKLPGFIKVRNENFMTLSTQLREWKELGIAKNHADANPSWFGLPLVLKRNLIGKRRQLVASLEKNKIATRPVFGGNLLKQPLYKNVEKRIIGDLTYSDHLMENAFWVGIHPSLNKSHFDYMKQKFSEALKDLI